MNIQSRVTDSALRRRPDLARRCLLVLALAVAMPGLAQAGNSRYLVVFKSESSPADAALRITSKGGRISRSFDQIGVAAVIGDADFASRMRKDSSVLAVGAENFLRPVLAEGQSSTIGVAGAPEAADALYPQQWNLRRIGAPALWARLPLAASPPRIALIDTGVMDDHPDLMGQVETSVATSYCSTSGGSNNSAGYPQYSSLVDFDAHPDWTPEDGCATASSTEYRLHGTHLAGIIAARFGGGMVVGVAPDAKLGVYKVFDRCRYSDEDGVHENCYGVFEGPMFSAIVQATLAGYPVINMSLGDYGVHWDKANSASWTAWDRIAKWADHNNALIVASMGNASLNLNGSVYHVPSDLPTVVGVTSTGTSQLLWQSGELVAAPGSDILAYRSNYGAAVDLSAPGGDCGANFPASCAQEFSVISTGIDAAGGATYLPIFGTSMASAQVSAVAGYVRSIHPGWSTGEVREWLKDTAQPIGKNLLFGAGLVDADAATR